MLFVIRFQIFKSSIGRNACHSIAPKIINGKKKSCCQEQQPNSHTHFSLFTHHLFSFWKSSCNQECKACRCKNRHRPPEDAGLRQLLLVQRICQNECKPILASAGNIAGNRRLADRPCDLPAAFCRTSAGSPMYTASRLLHSASWFRRPFRFAGGSPAPISDGGFRSPCHPHTLTTVRVIGLSGAYVFVTINVTPSLAMSTV